MSVLVTDIVIHVFDFMVKMDYRLSDMSGNEWGKGKCEGVSRELTEYLSGKGLEVQTIACMGLIEEIPVSAHPELLIFKGSNQEYLWHAIVKVDQVISNGKVFDTTIDLTGGQYGRKYAGIQIISFINIVKRWRLIKTHPVREEQKKGGFGVVLHENVVDFSVF